MDLNEGDIYAVALGHLVAELRKRKGLTQGQLAEILGVAQSSVSRIEKGQVTPNAYLLRQIASAFEMDVGDLTRMVDEVLERSRKAAYGAGLRSAVAGAPWWTVALGVAGFGGILGFIGYAVSAALHDHRESKKRPE